MSRLFKTHNIRKTFSQNGLWEFKTDPNREGETQKWYIDFPKDCTSMMVPSCWNNEMGFYEYEGIAWYHTNFTTGSQNIELSFGAVTGSAKVFLDGMLLGNHYGGFTEFHFVVTNLELGNHSLTVMIDSASGKDTIPLPRVDWYHYGGIIRDVMVSELKDVLIEQFHIKYELDNDVQNAIVNIDLKLTNLDSGRKQVPVKVYLNDALVLEQAVSVSGTEQFALEHIQVNGVSLWDIGQPNLYTVRIETSNDDLIDRIGFRKIEIKDRRFLLNGKEIYIKGVNRHEEHPEWGFAFPQKLMKKDIDIIKKLGCNAIRGSHYPNSKAFLDYLDCEGLLFWSEIPMWGYPEDALKNPVIIERGLQMHREMVEQYFNHPSIIIWGLHNEIDTRCEAGLIITKTFYKTLKSLDNSRLITFATDKILDDICLHYADFISINKYHGWYEGGIDRWPGFLEKVEEKLKKEGLEDVPVVMSEFGAAAIYGNRTYENIKWTEEYQANLFDYTMRLFHDSPLINGTYLWQFCDIRTAKEMGNDRARGFNNKGILNEYRKPKTACDVVTRIQSEF